MINTAVILAAGFGSRFKDKTLDRPKGFVDFMGKPIIMRSIENLIQSGIEKIIIGTGYQSYWYKNLEKEYPQITCVKINNYDSTGSLFTLFSCRYLIDADFLLLESDIVYEIDALEKIINYHETNAILTTTVTKFQDQLYVEKDKNSKLSDFSFNSGELNKVDGEWVGINKISLLNFINICEIINKNTKSYEKLCYEKIFLPKNTNDAFYVRHIPNLLWYEIDCEEDLAEAERIFSENIIQNKLLIPIKLKE